MSAPARAVALVAWFLLALAAARVLAVVAHDPLAGYANQFDMTRTAGCIGLWPDRPEAERALAHPAAPFARYVRGAPLPEWCQPGTEVALVAFVDRVDRIAGAIGLGDRDGLDLRALGAFKALLLLAAMLAVDSGLRASAGGRVVHAAIAAFVLADPFNTLWLNTLYTEFAALWGAYLSLGMLAVLASVAQPQRWAWALFVLGLAALGASRVQHAVLVPVLLVLAALAVRDGGRTRRIGLALGVVVATGALALHARTLRTHAQLAQVNRTDAVFGALLPASRDPAALLARLDLPPACGELIHVSWFLTRGRDPVAECAPAYALSNARIGAALLAEPRTLALALARGLALSTAWRVPYVGEIEGGELARLDHGPLGLTASVADPLARWSYAAQLGLWLVLFGAGLWAGARLLRHERTGGARAADALLAACAAVAGLGWLSAVAGDGYSEVARHVHLGANATLAAWLVLGARLPADIRGGAWLAAPAGLALGALLALTAQVGLRDQPLAFGVLQAPGSDSVPPGRLALSGRALDPSPIARIEARVGDSIRVPLALAPSPGIGSQFPLDDAGAGREFSGAIDFVPAEGPVELSIVVVYARGIETTIDRRWLRPAL